MRFYNGNATLDNILGLIVFVIILGFLAKSCNKNTDNTPSAKWEKYATTPADSNIDTQANNINQLINALKYDLQGNKIEQLKILQGMDVIKSKVFEMKNSTSIEYKKAEQERILAANERLKAQKEREIAEEERNKQFMENIKLSVFSFLLGLVPGAVSNDWFILFFKKNILRVPQEELNNHISLFHRIIVGFVLMVFLIAGLELIEYYS
ncbi:hypothetical protein [Thiothrix subterranea]|uniref:Uncharacterized protein n=1 Tax=Thiothrix subterranea TaxID=2735563 RepID=A0AA51R130_9GAMM|nr:hypothetical protein [Thiothrix subterranea]MDQ5769306.1 hypothetical protein [Thiothrix subterranea]WML86289.1 hypothetical protein RCG00_18595 [Thiothrix subterranea]